MTLIFSLIAILSILTIYLINYYSSNKDKNPDATISYLAFTLSPIYIVTSIGFGMHIGMHALIISAANAMRRMMLAIHVKAINFPKGTYTIGGLYEKIYPDIKIKKTANIIGNIKHVSMIAFNIIILNKILDKILNIKYHTIYIAIILLSLAVNIASPFNKIKYQIYILLAVVPLFAAHALGSSGDDAISIYQNITRLEFKPIATKYTLLSITQLYSAFTYQTIAKDTNKEGKHQAIIKSAWLILIIPGSLGIIGSIARPETYKGSLNDFEALLTFLSFMENGYLFIILQCTLAAMFIFAFSSHLTILIDTISYSITKDFFATKEAKQEENIQSKISLIIIIISLFCYLGLSQFHHHLLESEKVINLFLVQGIYISMFGLVLEMILLGYVPKNSHLLSGMAVGLISFIGITILSLWKDAVLELFPFPYIDLAVKIILLLQFLLPCLLNLITVITLSLLFNRPMFLLRKHDITQKIHLHVEN